MADTSVNAMEAYQKDPRIACQYGAKCYQKNPLHHERYKHPPAQATARKPAGKGQKRKIATKAAKKTLPKAKLRKNDESGVADKQRLSPTPSLSSDDEKSTKKASKISDSSSEDEESEKSDTEDEKSESEEEEKNDKAEKNGKIYESPEKTTSESTTSPDEASKSRESSKSPLPTKTSRENVEKLADSKKTSKPTDSVPEEKKNLIKKLFLLEMPPDFYKFYDFCTSLSPNSPGSAFKGVGLELVGPYDVLIGKIDEKADEDPKFLRHWRYFYDPPEFQTILKGNNKEGLHFGYWRDEDNKLPVFVAKNAANKDCKIIPVSENIFGAVFAHVEEKVKMASPFEKANFQRLSKKIKQYCNENKIDLQKETLNMKSRNRKMVTKTFHGAGIVVPYDKKTQVGYRTLAATDSQFKKILKEIEEGDDATKKEYMSKIDEMVRLATIAADECDFGTPLELAHDLFSCGLASVQKIAGQMFGMAYSLLRRPIFAKIAESHLKNRKKDCNLSVL